MQHILTQVRDYIQQRDGQREWQAGRDFVNYAGAYYDSDEYVAGVESLLQGWLVMGSKAQQFEREFCKQFNRPHGIVTNSGSSSNLLMMAALTSRRGHALPPGTKVLVPVAGFPTTVNPILQHQLRPVFVDIELDTLNLDLDQVEAALLQNPDIRVITFAHVLGNPPDMDRVMRLVNKHDLILLEDCCDALGSTWHGRPLGSFGLMASCSFYPAHHMTMGEGGYVATSDPATEVILRSFREWGRGCYCVGPEANRLKCGTCGKRFSEWIPALPGEVFDHKYVYDEVGYNLKPIEMQCAMGLEQIKKLPEIHALRRRNHQLLLDRYQRWEEFFHLPRATPGSDPSWFAFPITIRAGAPFSRNDMVDYLEEKLIQTRPYFAGNILLQPAYAHLMPAEQARNLFPSATHAMTHTLFHGTSPVITPQQIDYIGDVVDSFMSLF